MSYSFEGNFREVKPHIVVCFFCEIFTELNRNQRGLFTEEQAKVWRGHLAKQHGWVADELCLSP